MTIYARDSQRSKVYRWERECLRPLDEEVLTLAQCDRLVREVWLMHEGAAGHPPEIGDGRGRRKGNYSPVLHRINLPSYARRRYYVLHEIAHALFPASTTAAWHGPEWCAVYVRLLEKFGGWTSVRKSMRESGIKVK